MRALKCSISDHNILSSMIWPRLEVWIWRTFFLFFSVTLFMWLYFWRVDWRVQWFLKHISVTIKRRFRIFLFSTVINHWLNLQTSWYVVINRTYIKLSILKVQNHNKHLFNSFITPEILYAESLFQLLDKILKSL